ncbi:hypothetical protein [Phocaeicola coprophilus]|nr:hypothetical protein [Phocaeicola coprophilus]
MKKKLQMLAQVENSVYLCTAFERKRFHKESIGSLGEWLKPAVC